MIICFDGDRTLWDLTYDYQDCYKEVQAWMKSSFSFQVPLDIIETSVTAYIKYENKRHNYHRSVFPLSIMKAFNACYLYETGKTPSVELLSQAYLIGEHIYDNPPKPKKDAEDVLEKLKKDSPLVILTSGDRIIQSSKIYSTGLEPFFYETCIVSYKDIKSYNNFFQEHCDLYDLEEKKYICKNKEDYVMIGDSIKHDINPALEAGWYAIYIPSDKGYDANIIESNRLIIAHSLLDVPDIINNIKG